MHAYLLISQHPVEDQIAKLAAKLSAKTIYYPLTKIEDVRNLSSIVRLSFDKPTLIVCQNIHEAGEEALNAFLKNLEEPQENIYYALTAPSIRKVLPTISSRCQIIKIKDGLQKIVGNTEIEEFFKMTQGERLLFVDKIKDRAKAIEFAENMVFFMHGSLHKNGLKYSIDTEKIELAIKTLSRLKANGNVNLQLSNLVINM